MLSDSKQLSAGLVLDFTLRYSFTVGQPHQAIRSNTRIQYIHSLLPILLSLLCTSSFDPAGIGCSIVMFSVRVTPPNSQNPLLETGAVAIVVAMSASKATAPPCIRPIGLQRPGTASSSSRHIASKSSSGLCLGRASITESDRIRRASKPYWYLSMHKSDCGLYTRRYILTLYSSCSRYASM